MLNRFFRGAADRLIRRPAGLLVAAGISPNALTIAGFVVVAAASWLIAGGRLFLGGVVLVAGGFFDMVDGAVAKAGGKSSTRGAFLDSTTDRVSDALLFFAIFWQYTGRNAIWPVQAGSDGPSRDISLRDLGLWGFESQKGAMLALAALILGLLVSYIKARAEGLGLECKVGVAERPERIVIPALGLLSGRLIPALAILVALSAVTAVQRFAYVWRQTAQPVSDEDLK